MNDIIHWTLTRDEAQIVMNAIGELPTRIGMPIAQKLIQQATSSPHPDPQGDLLATANHDHLHPHKHTAVPLPNGHGEVA